MAAVPSESVLDQNGQNDHFGKNDLIPNWNLAFAGQKWTKMAHFGPFWSIEVYFGPSRSANRSLATPEGFKSSDSIRWRFESLEIRDSIHAIREI